MQWKNGEDSNTVSLELLSQQHRCVGKPMRLVHSIFENLVIKVLWLLISIFKNRDIHVGMAIVQYFW